MAKGGGSDNEKPMAETEAIIAAETPITINAYSMDAVPVCDFKKDRTGKFLWALRNLFIFDP